jgi:hypothetical protein
MPPLFSIVGLRFTKQLYQTTLSSVLKVHTSNFMVKIVFPSKKAGSNGTLVLKLLVLNKKLL